MNTVRDGSGITGQLFLQQHIAKVGAPGPELKNSPGFDDVDADFLSLDLGLESGVCCFNQKSFSIGDYVCSGDKLLRCEECGVWVREGSCYRE